MSDNEDNTIRNNKIFNYIPYNQQIPTLNLSF